MPGAARRTLRPEPREYFRTRDRFNPAALQIVVSPIERFPCIGELLKKLAYDILHPLVASASGIPRHFVRLRVYVGSEMHFHCVGSFLENMRVRRNYAASSSTTSLRWLHGTGRIA